MKIRPTLQEQLKKSGFPSGKDNADYYEEFRDWIPPSIDELVESVGKEVDLIITKNHVTARKWYSKECKSHCSSCTCDSSKTFLDGDASFIDEALANLWLQIEHEKEIARKAMSIKLPCLECKKINHFDLESLEAKGIVNVFCRGGECEDKYAIKQ